MSMLGLLFSACTFLAFCVEAVEGDTCVASEAECLARGLVSDMSPTEIALEFAEALDIHPQIAEHLIGDWIECDTNADWVLDSEENANIFCGWSKWTHELLDRDYNNELSLLEVVPVFEAFKDKKPEFGRGQQRNWEYEIIRKDTPWGGYDLPTTIDHKDVTREWLLGQTDPVLIKGATDDWRAHENWALEDLITRHGSEVYHVEPRVEHSFESLLNSTRGYHMGHTLRKGDCYAEGGRPYSPFMQDSVGEDFSIPKYLQPMATFQMGMGMRKGIGVVPEAHPSAFFVVIKGRKRWIISPPSKNPPRPSMRHEEGCHPRRIPKGSYRVDQEPGDIVWVPDFWWHETCGLDEWNIGVGGVTYLGCCSDSESQACSEDVEFLLDGVGYCQEHKCPTLDENGYLAPHL